jgi:hypothetical protein
MGQFVRDDALTLPLFNADLGTTEQYPAEKQPRSPPGVLEIFHAGQSVDDHRRR